MDSQQSYHLDWDWILDSRITNATTDYGKNSTPDPILSESANYHPNREAILLQAILDPGIGPEWTYRAAERKQQYTEWDEGLPRVDPVGPKRAMTARYTSHSGRAFQDGVSKARISALQSDGVSVMSELSSATSFVTAMSTSSFRTAPSTSGSSAALMRDKHKFETIMEIEGKSLPVPQEPLGKLGSDYQAELRERQLIQPFDKELNWSGKGQHVVYQPQEKVPLEFMSHLGASITARVEMVRCRRVALARKTMRCKGNWNQNNVLQEVSHLQKLRHGHIVQLVGTYLQGRDFSLLMYPAADCHLGNFLEETEDFSGVQFMLPEYSHRIEFLCSAFHCLAAAVEHVHINSTKHMDIKPKNILVKLVGAGRKPYWKIYLADFGLSRSFCDQGHSQTDGPTSLTPKYCAPEVYDYGFRGRSADIFSLGCVYAEMLTVIAEIAGKGLADFAEFRRNEDNDESFHKNLEKVNVWIKDVSACSKRTTHTLRDFILQLLSENPEQRPTANELMLFPFEMAFNFYIDFRSKGCCIDGPEPYVFYKELSNPILFPHELDSNLHLSDTPPA